MSDEDARFTGSIPEFYDRHLGPVFMEPYARDLAARVPADAARVLEIAAGTGIVTRRLRERLAPAARLTVTDLNTAMLDYARARLGDDGRTTWQPADVQALAFPDGSFDAVVCQFGVMFFPDKPAALREMRRVLAAGGTLLFNTWDAFERNPWARIIHESIVRHFPGDPPLFYLTPFSMGDVKALRELVEGAGFSGVRIETVPFAGRSESAAHLAVGAVRGNPVRLMIEERGTATVEEIERDVARSLAAVFGAAPVRVPLSAHVVTATR